MRREERGLDWVPDYLWGPGESLSTARLIKLVAQCFVLSKGLRNGADQAEETGSKTRWMREGRMLNPGRGQGTDMEAVDVGYRTAWLVQSPWGWDDTIVTYGLQGPQQVTKSLDTQFSSVQSLSCIQLWDPMDCSTPGLPVHHQRMEFTQTLVHWVGDAIQPSHPLLFPSHHTFSLSQHQGLFKWVSSLHQVAKVLEFQLQHQSFQWIFSTDFL